MKQLLVIICCCLSLAAQAQQKPLKKKTHRRHVTAPPPPPPPVIYTYVEQRAEFPGGSNALLQYVHTNTRYPEQAREAGVTGKVLVQFVVGTDGSVTDVSLLRCIGAGCDEEAVRVVKSLPRWRPGKKQGYAVKSYFILPIKFTIKA